MIAVQGSDEKTTQETLESSIEIELSEGDYYFDEFIYPKFKIVKGDTSKYVIKIYLLKENKKSDPASIYIYGKNKEVEVKIPFLLEFPNQKSAEYYFVAEGLDITEKVPIKIMEKQMLKTQQTTDINLIYFSENITNETTINLQLKNNDEVIKKYEIWSYVYSGPISYSGNRTQNKQTIFLEPISTKTIFLKNYLTEIPDKELKIKINILEEGKKTPKEIIKNLSLKKVESIKPIFKNTTYEKNNTITLSEITGQTIYKSSSAKIEDYSHFFLIAIILMSIFAIFKIKRI